MNRYGLANWFLRGGIAFAFLYAAISGFIAPFDWIDYIPQFMTASVDAVVLLRVWGVVEIILALWILSGYKMYIPCTIAALSLIAIVLFNVGQFELLFRDLSIAAAAISLMLGSYRSTPSGSLPGQR